MIEQCELCQRYRASQAAQPLQQHEASKPMEELHMDLAQYGGKDYCVIVDKYSGFIWCYLLKSTTSAAIIKCLEDIFNIFGYCHRIKSDNAPNLTSRELEESLKEKNISRIVSSPYHSQSAGTAEANKNATQEDRVMEGLSKSSITLRHVLTILISDKSDP